MSGQQQNMDKCVSKTGAGNYLLHQQNMDKYASNAEAGSNKTWINKHLKRGRLISKSQ